MKNVNMHSHIKVQRQRVNQLKSVMGKNNMHMCTGCHLIHICKSFQISVQFTNIYPDIRKSLVSYTHCLSLNSKSHSIIFQMRFCIFNVTG